MVLVSSRSSPEAFARWAQVCDIGGAGWRKREKQRETEPTKETFLSLERTRSRWFHYNLRAAIYLFERI